jgi:subtilisin family serine protease
MTTFRRSLLTFSVLTSCATSACRDVVDPSQRILRDRPDISSSSISLNPTRDSYLSVGFPNTNFGSADTLMVGKLTPSTQRTVIAFDSAAIRNAVGTDSLVSVVLKLTITRNGGSWGPSGRHMSIHRLIEDWTEAGVTRNCRIDTNSQNNQPDCPSAAWSSSSFVATATDSLLITNATLGVLSFSVTSDIRSLLAGTSSHMGWMLKHANETEAGLLVFASRESQTPPQLILTTESVGVPATAPDTIAAWVYSDSNVERSSPNTPAVFLKHIVIVQFATGATQAQRQSAVDAVNGTVVGGSPVSSGEGQYYLSVPDTLGGIGLRQAVAALSPLPQVQFAMMEIAVETLFRRPKDGAGFVNWHLGRDSLVGPNWGLEAVFAPLAWGCETGSSSTRVAVVDTDFDALSSDMRGMTLHPLAGAPPPVPGQHGTSVASVIAARGDNDSLMTGTMWRADLHGYEVGSLPIPAADTGFVGRVIHQVQAAALDGAKVINLSLGPVTKDTLAVSDSILASAAAALDRMLDQLESMSPSIQPLLVIAASNFPWDAKWGGFPRINATHPKRVLVVTSSDASGALFVGHARGPLVDIAAPGVGVSTIKNGTIIQRTGTSFAAPFVTGIAGLLFSFDPRLTRDSVHDLIINGAVAGNWITTGAASFPIANAYESLKLAAERPGAPLCGNRVWWDTTGALKVQRTTSVDETLITSLSLGFGDHVIVEHGGRKLSRCDYVNTPCTPLLEYTNGAWGSPAQTTPYLSDSPTLRSLYAVSHDADSSVTGQPLGSNTWQLLLHSPQGSGGTALGLPIQIQNAQSSSGIFVAWNPFGPDVLVVVVRVELNFIVNLEFNKLNLATGSLTPFMVRNNHDYLGGAVREDGRELVINVRDMTTFDCSLEYWDYSTGSILRTIPQSSCEAMKGGFSPRALTSRRN